MARDSWSGDEVDEPVRRVVASLLRLASSDDACRLLGVDGTLEDEIDVVESTRTFIGIGGLHWTRN